MTEANASTLTRRLIRRKDNCMDFSEIQRCGIRNLAHVFGCGLRGETWAAARNRRWIEAAVGMGVRRLIDLRTADHNDKLMVSCQQLGIEYYHFPVDSCVQNPDELARNLPALFRLIHEGGFYISCQQGLHRTDIALALYYFFHDANEVPVMFGHIRKGMLRCDDIMRRINAMRPYFPEVDEDEFQTRRKRFLLANREWASVKEA